MGRIQDLLAVIRKQPDHLVVRALDELLPRWIPVSERLPDGRETVLLSDGDWVTMGRKSSDEWYVIESAEACGYHEFSRLPFWMPLPEPPEVK